MKGIVKKATCQINCEFDASCSQSHSLTRSSLINMRPWYLYKSVLIVVNTFYQHDQQVMVVVVLSLLSRLELLKALKWERILVS